MWTLKFCAAEEGGYGKVRLLEKGAYAEMDACVMYETLHRSHNLIPTLTVKHFDIVGAIQLPDLLHPLAYQAP